MSIFDFLPVVTPIHTEFDSQLESMMNKYESYVGSRSTRVRPIIIKIGWIAAIEQVVSRDTNSASFIKTKKLGMEAYAWEVFVVEHTDLFSDTCVANAKIRMGIS